MKRRTCPAHRVDLSQHGGHPPKRSGCGKLQIVILSGRQIENSSTHDFELHISASYKPRQPCLAILIYTIGGCPFNGPLSGTKYPTRAASPIKYNADQEPVKLKRLEP